MFLCFFVSLFLCFFVSLPVVNGHACVISRNMSYVNDTHYSPFCNTHHNIDGNCGVADGGGGGGGGGVHRSGGGVPMASIGKPLISTQGLYFTCISPSFIPLLSFLSIHLNLLLPHYILPSPSISSLSSFPSPLSLVESPFPTIPHPHFTHSTSIASHSLPSLSHPSFHPLPSPPLLTL